MLYIFHGTDDYFRKLHVQRLTDGLGLEVVRLADGDKLPEAGSLVGGDLFGGHKIFIVHSLLSRFLTEDTLPGFKLSANHIIFLESSIDKRLTLIKKLLKEDGVVIQEFVEPRGEELAQWVTRRVEQLGGSIAGQVVEYLLSRLGVEMEEKRYFGKEHGVSLWQIDSEIGKLLVFAAGNPITVDMIDALVPEVLDTQGFDIINALADKNKPRVFTLCEQFFSQSGGTDEKAKFILLNSLLADQFRNILIVKGFAASRITDSEAMTRTGWKPGRLFVLKKIAAKFEENKVVETLSKLESLDIELKTTSTPGHVILDLILAQAV